MCSTSTIIPHHHYQTQQPRYTPCCCTKSWLELETNLRKDWCWYALCCCAEVLIPVIKSWNGCLARFYVFETTQRQRQLCSLVDDVLCQIWTTLQINNTFIIKFCSSPPFISPSLDITRIFWRPLLRLGFLVILRAPTCTNIQLLHQYSGYAWN